MTDRVNAILVTLEDDLRIDDVESTLAAIRHIKGVVSVTPNVANIQDHIAYERATGEILTRFSDLIRELRR